MTGFFIVVGSTQCGSSLSAGSDVVHLFLSCLHFSYGVLAGLAVCFCYNLGPRLGSIPHEAETYLRLTFLLYTNATKWCHSLETVRRIEFIYRRDVYHKEFCTSFFGTVEELSALPLEVPQKCRLHLQKL